MMPGRLGLDVDRTGSIIIAGNQIRFDDGTALMLNAVGYPPTLPTDKASELGYK